jgi:ATP synthase protein I
MQQVHSLDARRAKRILVAQMVATLVVALIGLMFGPRAGFFALLGGAIATIANALFAFWVFGRYRAAEPGKLLAQIYGGEVLKLGFIAGTFAAVIVWLEPLSPLALFGAFFVVQVLPPLLANRVAG